MMIICGVLVVIGIVVIRLILKCRYDNKVKIIIDDARRYADECLKR